MNKLLLFLFVLVASCGTGEQPRAVTHNGKPQFIFLVNPNDCVTCLRNFTNVFIQLKQQVPRENIQLLLPGKRTIEQGKIKEDLFPAGEDHPVTWDTETFNSMYKQFPCESHQSYLLVKRNDSLLFYKPVKDLLGLTEIEKYLHR